VSALSAIDLSRSTSDEAARLVPPSIVSTSINEAPPSKSTPE